MRFKIFTLDELFDSANGDFDIQQKHLNEQGEIVVSSGETNMGVIGKTDIEAKIFDENTITVDMFGNVYFRSYKYKMVTHARVFSLKLKPEFGELGKEAGLYLVAEMQYFRKLYSYDKMASWKKCSKMTVELPVDNSDHIDFNYMQSRIRELELARIRELELARIRELEAYLKVTGLSDYRLTADEEALLRESRERERE